MSSALNLSGKKTIDTTSDGSKNVTTLPSVSKTIIHKNADNKSQGLHQANISGGMISVNGAGLNR